MNENNKYNILWELITAQNGAGLSDTPETPMTDTPRKNPESCTESDTPETDAVLNQFEHHLPNWLASEIMAAVARKLERERNEAIRSCHIWQTGNSALVRDRDEAIWDCNQRINKISAEREDWKTIAVEYEKEIEEWKVEVERWRSLAQGWREEAVNAIKDTRG